MMFYQHDARFKKQFATYLADGVSSGDIEEIYSSAHAAIREDPTFKPTDKSTDWKSESAKHKAKRLTHAQRQANIATKIAKFKANGGVENDDGDD